MTVAIFDLDNTLLAHDSDLLWGRYLVERGLVDAEEYDRANEQFYAQYKQGTLDITQFLRFALRPLSEHDTETLNQWRNEFVETKIRPEIAPGAPALLKHHRERGHTLLIITATNRFVTEPIAALLGVPNLLATQPELRNGRYTGDFVGIPTFREGKVSALHAWLQANDETLENSWFYSDSHNDLALLEAVTHPVAVDPDPELRGIAEEQGWKIITLR
jgi:HAD superfamily hydrolase (TIGR01490 family)